MIRHIVLFSAKNPQDIPHIKAGLELLQDIPHVSLLEVKVNEKLDVLDNEFDVIVYGEFATAEDLALYKKHQLYQDAIVIVRPLRKKRIAVDMPV